MQELTLTGATLLGNSNNNNSSNNHNHHDHDHSQQQQPCEHHHHHHHHTTTTPPHQNVENNNNKTTHSVTTTTGTSTTTSNAGTGNTTTTTNNNNGFLQMNMSATELVNHPSYQKNDTALLQTIIGIVRMGSYELFYEILMAWKDKQKHEKQQNEKEKNEKQQNNNNNKNKDLNSNTNNKENHNNKDVDEILLQYDPNGHTVTHWAAKRVDEIRFMEYLLQIPYPTTTTTSTSSGGGSSSSSSSSTTGSTNPMTTIVHIPSKDSTCMTPIHWCCTMPNALRLLHIMLQHTTVTSSNSNSNNSNTIMTGLEVLDGAGCTPLLIASQHGQVDTVAYLIQKGANIHAVDHSHDSAIHWAAYKGSISVLGLLTYYDTSSSSTTTSSTTSTSEQHETFLQVPDIYGQTPLHLAALRGHTTAVRYILQQLIVVSGSSSESTTIHHRSSSRHCKKKIQQQQLTLSTSTTSNTRQNNQNHHNNNNQNRIVQEMLFLKDKNGRTPYELAIHKERKAVAKVLQDMEQQIMKYQYHHTNGNNSSSYYYYYYYYSYVHPVWKVIRSMFTINAWKHWLGMDCNNNNNNNNNGGGYDEMDESPTFPLYYVWFNIIVHIFYNIIVFVPILKINNNNNTNNNDGILWDCLSIHMIQLILIITTCCILYVTTTMDPGTLNEQQCHYYQQLYEKTLEELATNTTTSTTTTNTNTNTNTSNTSTSRLCHTCHIYRPLRSKHDKFTRQCILVFDHHCPFVGNTIGLNNYRFFYSFLGTLTWYLSNFWYLFILYVSRTSSSSSSSLNTTNNKTSYYYYLTVIVGIYLGLHILFSLGMFIYHTQLIYMNLTTNEHMNLHKYEYLWKNTTTTTGTPPPPCCSNDDPNHHHNHNHRIYSNPFDQGFIKNFMSRMFPHQNQNHYYSMENNYNSTLSLLSSLSPRSPLEEKEEIEDIEHQRLLLHSNSNNNSNNQKDTTRIIGSSNSTTSTTTVLRKSSHPFSLDHSFV